MSTSKLEAGITAAVVMSDMSEPAVSQKVVSTSGWFSIQGRQKGCLKVGLTWIMLAPIMQRWG
jgi:hypothetical protein